MLRARSGEGMVALGLGWVAIVGCGEAEHPPRAGAENTAVVMLAHSNLLPNCTEGKRNDVYYVSSSEQFYYCDGRNNQPINVVGTPGAPGAAGVSWLVSVGAATTASCGNGGVAFRMGPDNNGNGVLDAAEVVSSAAVCNGEPGPKGDPGVAGPQGDKGEPGADGADGSNGVNGTNGMDGAAGPQGSDGLTSLVALSTETPGPHCEHGGTRVDAGVDADRDGVLDADEVDATSYVCAASVVVCGNGRIDAGEVCDGAELGGATCRTLGHVGGTLSCNATCDALDTSACLGSLCGNGSVEGTEQCDGANLAGSSCTAFGFEGGTLSCSPSCELDVGSCTRSETSSTPYFSEYVEGSGNNKAVEIFNPGSEPLSLVGCTLRLYANGASLASTSIALTSTVAPGGVYVACHSSISPLAAPFCDLLSSSINFNGDDAVELVCGGVSLDVIGQIGTDPGVGWGSGGAATQDRTIRRRCSVTVGDALGSDPFDPANEWVGFPTDTLTGLGSSACAP